MGLDEQKEEREVLDSIYADEITDISETQYQIAIPLDVTIEDGDESEPPTIVLQVTYPPTYPDVAPELALHDPPSASKYTHLDLSEDAPSLLAKLTPTIEENIGIQMIFTLASCMKEEAEALIASRQAAVRAAQEAVIAQAEMEENRKFQGETVTRESFTRWRDGFVMERELAKELEKAEEERGKKIEKKLTGKELWERGLVGKTGDGEEGEEEEEAIDLASLRVGE
ncbi:MAG: hypothetical protein M1814_002367 [Vezdaea aestivalis]|nr:MAG: hypothetical protein M1814_002367 [Vezdaea aestivalis]